MEGGIYIRSHATSSLRQLRELIPHSSSCFTPRTINDVRRTQCPYISGLPFIVLSSATRRGHEILFLSAALSLIGDCFQWAFQRALFIACVHLCMLAYLNDFHETATFCGVDIICAPFTFIGCW